MNVTDESEIDMDAIFEDMAGDKLKMVVIMTSFNFLAVICNLWSIYVVRKNVKINPAVRTYFHADHILRIIFCGLTIGITPTCSYLYWCQELSKPDFGSVMGQIVGYLRDCVNFSTNLFTLAMALNRLFAVIRGGICYKIVIRKVKLQSVILICLPLLLESPLMMKGEIVNYDPYSNAWYRHGNISDIINNIFWIDAGIVIWTMVICIDSATAWKVRRTMAKTEHSTIKKVDVQIIKQVLTLHFFSLTHFIILQILAIIDLFQYTGYWEMMWISDVGPALIHSIAGLSRVYFLGIPKKGSQAPQSSQPSFSSTRNTERKLTGVVPK